jgi:hypothetical protein
MSAANELIDDNLAAARQVTPKSGRPPETTAEAPAPLLLPQQPPAPHHTPGATISLQTLIETAADQHRRQAEQAAAQAAARALQARSAHD